MLRGAFYSVLEARCHRSSLASYAPFASAVWSTNNTQTRLICYEGPLALSSSCRAANSYATDAVSVCARALEESKQQRYATKLSLRETQN